ncbi:gliding motility lipoprotein GldD [Labilibaculum filiforme]|uniref:Gliding motility lipoprotein GldD n=1 Tax=Labilibaculum filiforme TaxID=1940526 RepID=A0A2N3I5U5_9BACT|nr:gliding motility lipoprotein GldD [Labilibaculum filiforme]PKQ65675.1 gliding motility lipoprotein GldD [Labilibaculum filiforme]
MKLYRKLSILLFLLIAFTAISCKKKYTPKPKAYYRIDFPAKEYQNWNSDFPYSFDLLSMAKIEKDASKGAEKYWLNIQYPDYRATIHLSYKTVDNNLEEYLEDSRKMAYKHSIVADAIAEQVYFNDTNKVYGMIYRIKGNAASSVQFIATDSTSHFLRGALYFREHPNQDSLAPVIQFIDKDIVRLMESLKWE